jgi:hypothetical protein
VPTVSVVPRGPPLVESKALERRAKRHEAGAMAARVITDVNGSGTVVSVP